MTVAAYLKQGWQLDQRIGYRLRKLAEMRQNVYSLPGLTFCGDRVQSSLSGDAAFVRALVRMEAMQEAIREELDQLADLRKQMQDVISQTEDEKLMLTLTYRYMEGMSYQQIADLLQVDPSTVKRWHQTALRLITLPEDAIAV